MPHRRELARRMALPQRHRLLQGYPMLPLHRVATPAADKTRALDGALRDVRRAVVEPAWIGFDASRPLIIGVLPHAQCNPKVAGCGFCTFSHDPFDKTVLRETVHEVAGQISELARVHPEIAARRVDAVYFGGATANLTPPKSFARLGAELASRFDLSRAEVTLEGVPSLFRSLLTGIFDVFAELPARHHRVSMGVQTFDATWIARMGRQAFGDRRTVASVIERAHARGMTISGDFLINLPGEPRERMLEDVRIAAESGLDQICVYHLVLTADTAAQWSKDAALMAALPTNEVALDHWLAVRDGLLANGFVQTTLTNFERSELATDRRFAYEACSFAPDRYDAIGFGPTSISTLVDLAQRRAVKLVRGKDLYGQKDALFFPYEEEDLRLLFVTRMLARLEVDRARYRDVFGGDVTAHFSEAIDAVSDAGLVTVSDEALKLTTRGMFYADSVAGLLAWRRAETLRELAAGRHTRDVLDRRVVVDFMG